MVFHYKDPAATVPTPAIPDAGCEAGYVRYGDACYKRYDVKKTWHSARQTCMNEGTELASIQDPIGNSAVFHLLMQQGQRVWIGLYKPTVCIFFAFSLERNTYCKQCSTSKSMKSKFSLKGLTFIKSSSHSQGGLSHVTQKNPSTKKDISL